MTKNGKPTRLFQKIGTVVLGAEKASDKRRVDTKVKPLRKPKHSVPEKLRGFFESRHAGWPEYVMLKVQLTILSLFFVAIIYLVFLPAENLIFVTLLSIFSGYLVYLVLTQLKCAFKRDYSAYKSFVAICIAMAWIFVLVLKFTRTIFSAEASLLTILPPSLAIGIVAVAFATFKFKYRRDFTYGVVEEARGRTAVIRVSYDIRSNVGAGLYLVDSFIRVKRGDVVKVSVEGPFLGLGGSKVKTIVAKVCQS